MEVNDFIVFKFVVMTVFFGLGRTIDWMIIFLAKFSPLFLDIFVVLYFELLELLLVVGNAVNRYGYLIGDGD